MKMYSCYLIAFVEYDDRSIKIIAASDIEPKFR